MGNIRPVTPEDIPVLEKRRQRWLGLLEQAHGADMQKWPQEDRCFIQRLHATIINYKAWVQFTDSQRNADIAPEDILPPPQANFTLLERPDATE